MEVAFDELWDYGDPAGTETRLLAARPAAGDPPGLLVEWHTQLARTHSLRRNFDEAHRLLDLAESLPAADEPVPRARIQLERGRSFNSAGERDRARPLFLAAWELAHGVGSDFHAVDAAHMVAIVSKPEEAMAWNERGLAVAEDAGDPLARRWIGSLCNNIGWTHHGAGAYEKALASFERALEARKRYGRPSDVPVARWCVGRCLRSLGRFEDALAVQQALAAEGSEDGYVDEELGECLLALGRRDEARPHFARAHEKLSADAWMAEHEADRLARLKRLAEPE